MRRPQPYRQKLWHDRRGVAAVEFAIVAPLFLLVTMGLFDLSYQFYIKSALEGAMEAAGREATLETYAVDQAALDDAVRDKVHAVNASATLTFSRRAYQSFSEVGRPERFTDANGNGSFDSGECFEDLNANSAWDSDSGTIGNGGAENVVAYTAAVDVTRVFPLWKMLGQPQVNRISATTILRNQPYADGSAPTAQTIC